jgi:hypothetical protein
MQALLIVLAALISIGSIKYSAPLNMPTNPAATSGWSIRYSPGMPPSMSQSADGTYYVDLPYQKRLHYVVQGAQGDPTGKTITIKFELVGTGELLAADPKDSCPCNVSIFLQQQGDSLTAADESNLANVGFTFGGINSAGHGNAFNGLTRELCHHIQPI